MTADETTGTGAQTGQVEHTFTLTRAITLLLTVTAGTSVAALYYAQPLLVIIATNLHTSTSLAGLLVTASQVGYVVGLALLVPLGDIVDRRTLITRLLALAVVAALVAACAPNFWVLCAALVFCGITSATAMVVVPFAAGVAAPHERGRVTGTVMSGVMLGILLARTISGALAELGGWRTIYAVSAVAFAILAVCVWRMLPSAPATATVRYPRLLASIATLIRAEPLLRGRMALGFLSMGGFTLMWTASTFLLARDYGFSAGVIGLFGLAGAAGAAGAPVIGRLFDRGHAHVANTVAWASILIGWGLLALGHHTLVAFVLGLLLFDFGSQAMQICNQNRIYSSLDPAARSRITTAYMVTFFLGGVAGSALAAPLYDAGGWGAVCLAGTVVAVVGLALWGAIYLSRERSLTAAH